jgi:hypothetical protein
MPLFSFRTHDGQYSSSSDDCELSGSDEAWNELTKICGDLVAGRCHDLGQNAQWSIEVLDAAKIPLFRIRLVAETLILSLPMACFWFVGDEHSLFLI